MPYSLKLKSSDNWVSSKFSGEMKKLNTDYLFETDNIYGFPKVSSDDFIPKDLTAFNVFHSKGHTINKEEAVHFFIDDYKFEQVWSNPRKHLGILSKCSGIISPTFSIWENQPFALNLFNLYRSRWYTRFAQDNGIKVIVDVRWADESSFDYCFSGINRYSPVIVNTVGTRQLENRKLFILGFEEMLRVIEPCKLFVYGEYMPVEFEKYFDEVHYYESFWAKQRKKMR